MLLFVWKKNLLAIVNALHVVLGAVIGVIDGHNIKELTRDASADRGVVFGVHNCIIMCHGLKLPTRFLYLKWQVLFCPKHSLQQMQCKREAGNKARPNYLISYRMHQQSRLWTRQFTRMLLQGLSEQGYLTNAISQVKICNVKIWFWMLCILMHLCGRCFLGILQDVFCDV